MYFAQQLFSCKTGREALASLPGFFLQHDALRRPCLYGAAYGSRRTRAALAANVHSAGPDGQA